MSPARRPVLAAWAVGAVLFAGLLCARSQWSTTGDGAVWPSTNHYRFPATNAAVLATNVWWTQYQTIVTQRTALGTTWFTNRYAVDITIDRYTNRATAGTVTTTTYDGVWRNVGFGGIYELAVTNTTNDISTTWWETNAPLAMQAKDRAEWEAWEAEVERVAAIDGTGDVRRVDLEGPDFFRWGRSALLSRKITILLYAESFVIPCDLAAYAQANPDAPFPPMWTPATILASNGLPADWLTNTPWRALYGEGTNVPQWDGVRRCFNAMRWTATNATMRGSWTNSTMPYGEDEVVGDFFRAVDLANSNGTGDVGVPVYGLDTIPPAEAARPLGAFSRSVTLYGYNPEALADQYGFRAYRGSAVGTVATGQTVTVRPAAIEVWTRARAPDSTNCVLDYHGAAGIATSHWTKVEDIATDATGVYHGVTSLGHAGAATWCASPPSVTNESAARGYLLEPPVLIFKHDVEGGFRFVPD